MNGPQDDVRYDAKVGDHRQVRSVDLGDVGVRPVSHEQIQRRRNGTVSGAPTAQDGIVFQAGTPDFWVSAIVDSGACVAAETRGLARRGKPLAMQDGNTLCLM